MALCSVRLGKRRNTNIQNKSFEFFYNLPQHIYIALAKVFDRLSFWWYRSRYACRLAMTNILLEKNHHNPSRLSFLFKTSLSEHVFCTRNGCMSRCKKKHNEMDELKKKIQQVLRFPLDNHKKSPSKRIHTRTRLNNEPSM